MNQTKELTIICVSYKRYHPIQCLIHSLLSQSIQNFKLIILHDGYDKTMDHMLGPYKDIYSGSIDYMFTQDRYNDYGHTLRDQGIQLTDTEWILQTNDDNYYCPKFLEFVKPHMNPSVDIIMWDMIHSHNNPGGRTQAAYQPFRTFFKKFNMDVGCFIARTSLAKQVGFRDKTFAGDATYFEDIANLSEPHKWAKIDRTLFVHN